MRPWPLKREGAGASTRPFFPTPERTAGTVAIDRASKCRERRLMPPHVNAGARNAPAIPVLRPHIFIGMEALRP